MASFSDQLLGATGIVNLNSGTAWTGDAYLIVAQTDVTVTTFTENNATGAVSGDFVAGTQWQNASGITAFTASSGKVRIHLR